VGHREIMPGRRCNDEDLSLCHAARAASAVATVNWLRRCERLKRRGRGRTAVVLCVGVQPAPLPGRLTEGDQPRRRDERRGRISRMRMQQASNTSAEAHIPPLPLLTLLPQNRPRPRPNSRLPRCRGRLLVAYKTSFRPPCKPTAAPTEAHQSPQRSSAQRPRRALHPAEQPPGSPPFHSPSSSSKRRAAAMPDNPNLRRTEAKAFFGGGLRLRSTDATAWAAA
jgi:hypothetical protein